MNNKSKQIILLLFIGVVVFILGNLFSNGFSYDSVNALLIDFIIYQVYTFVVGFGNIKFFDYLNSKNWEGRIIKRVFIGLFGSTIVTFLSLYVVRFLVAISYLQQSFEDFYYNQSLGDYIFGMWIGMSIIVTWQIIYFYNKYQQNKIKEQKVIAGTASAKFDALKNQLDPHFLFNSLNVLSSLIEENPENAQKFTTGLSKVYRYVLEQKNKELVSVDEELKFAKTYMSLLKMRFEDSIVFEIPDQASDPESKVVPLALQLLLENAVKHNMVTSSKPLYIKIYEMRGMLVVENNLQPKQIVKKSSGVGLENIKQRYHLLSKRRVSINQTAERFAVAIPMLTKQVSIMTRTESQQNQRLDRAYVNARNYVEELKGFYYSLISYFFVIPFLIFIWYKFTPFTFQWFWFPMIGWGIGLCFQAYRVFVNDGLLGQGWEKRKIEEYMKEEEQTNRWD
ncbi:MAG: histidine kinase [Bacteroidetes bacterium MedPE-SWsnd-G2]|nr:MAG: histidine kinase [Bacteroidetes bacterium MedPE-SWsnd-G2]